jgi:hypothetical protein
MTKAIKKFTLIKNKTKQNIINNVLRHLRQQKQIREDESSSDAPYQKDCVKEHYYTFQLKEELFTLLYTSYIFKWFQTDRVNLH